MEKTVPFRRFPPPVLLEFPLAAAAWLGVASLQSRSAGKLGGDERDCGGGHDDAGRFVSCSSPSVATFSFSFPFPFRFPLSFRSPPCVLRFFASLSSSFFYRESESSPPVSVALIHLLYDPLPLLTPR